MSKTCLTIAVLILALAAPVAARAQENSAIDQYTENVPGADADSGSGGDDASSGSGSPGGSGTSGDPAPSGSSTAPAPELPPESSEALGAAGEDGAAAADLAQSTAPDGGDRKGGDQAQGPGANSDGRDRGDRIVDATAAPPAEEASSDGGVAPLLIILGITLLAAIGYAIFQRARRRDDGRFAADSTA